MVEQKNEETKTENLETQTQDSNLNNEKPNEEQKDPLLYNLVKKMSNMSIEEIAKSYIELNNKYQECLKTIDRKENEYYRKLKEQKKEITKNVFSLFLDVLKVNNTRAQSKEDNCKFIREAFNMFNSKTKKFFENYNVSVIIPSENEPFDYKFHEAIGTVKSSDKENDAKIASVIEYGLSMEGEVILPAKVLVYKFE